MITATQISKKLIACKFNPKTPGPMKVLSEIVTPEYARTRIAELALSMNVTDTEELRLIIQLAVISLVKLDG